jgi:hypothetical protein
MKISKTQLKQIIKEELDNLTNEAYRGRSSTYRIHQREKGDPGYRNDYRRSSTSEQPPENLGFKASRKLVDTTNKENWVVPTKLNDDLVPLSTFLSNLSPFTVQKDPNLASLLRRFIVGDITAYELKAALNM